MKDAFEPYNTEQEIRKFVQKNILPKIPENMFFLFIKNGTYSDKFNFSESCKCRCNLSELTTHFININYNAALVGADGHSETVLREYIDSWNYINENIPCIYNGMPLRPEFRIFYDFDKRKVLYSVNCWDWDYCHESIFRNATDKIVFAARREYLEKEFVSRKTEVEKLVSDHLSRCELSGQWSVDILWDEKKNEYWLIDMALARQSAYWNPKIQ